MRSRTERGEIRIWRGIDLEATMGAGYNGYDQSLMNKWWGFMNKGRGFMNKGRDLSR